MKKISFNFLSDSDNPSLIFNELKRKNSDRVITGHININVIENKFEPLVALVKDKVDIKTKTKINSIPWVGVVVLIWA